MPRRARPNDPCPCGSELKFKKCCGAPGATANVTAPAPVPGRAASRPAPYSANERATAIAKLVALWESQFADEAEIAHEEFWGGYLDHDGELPPVFAETSLAAEQAWFAFDRTMDDGRRVVDVLLEDRRIGPGERAFLRAARSSTQRLYEVVDVLPGRSITLEDLLEGTRVTVHERSASRSVGQRDCLAARVVACGYSGHPEMELGVIMIPRLYREQVVLELEARRAEFSEEVPGAPVDEFHREQPPFFHEVWLGSIFDPAVPTLANTDGEPVVTTISTFAIRDAAALRRRLDAAAPGGLVRMMDDAWDWVGPTHNRDQAVLATLRQEGTSLIVETNSVARGERARALVERLAADAVVHRSTTHEDVTQAARAQITARILGMEPTGDANGRRADDVIDPAVAESVVLDHQARHYREWIDLPLPALGGRSPRDAAVDPAIAPQVIALLRDLGAMYQGALRAGEPAYDPSWMWGELGLASTNAPATLPTAHERIAAAFPGFIDATRGAADRLRAAPGFDPAATVPSAADIDADLTLQRWIRGDAPLPDPRAGVDDDLHAPPFDRYARLLVAFELHRRKTFWVDETLAYLFDHTDAELAGEPLRAPFPCCAFVFVDRHVLGLAERMLARHRDDPLCGQILRGVTAYVIEVQRDDGDALEVTFALDSLGADPPSLVVWHIPADPNALSDWLAHVAPTPIVDPPVHDASPVRALVRVMINALRYATSASMTNELRPRQVSPSSPPSIDVPASDSVFHLPGKIDIRQLRTLQELQRTSDGRQALARFMVRGHWRRAPASWSDRRPRWIEPYWKGPELAVVIERTYRLRGTPPR